MPSHLDTARSGLSARSVRMALNEPILAPSLPLSSPARVINEICKIFEIQ